MDARFESFDDEAQAILAEDRFLAVFTHYRKHVLLDEQGRQNYRALLSSHEALELTRDELLYPGEKEVTYKGNVERLMRIEVFKEALAWQDNPAREYILDMMEEMLLEDNLLSELGREMHRSLAANKMELFELLYQHAPARTAGLLEQSKDGRLAKLIEYIVRETERTSALEAAGALSPG
ncbi:hypothetical protein [Polyangium sorediatum]|uniref:Uncharacterized protein n=1 Tax=Polyangium sorediatum TaxID=889274 RepID=A0ABT6NNF4_9BACT|nr:hypothetical protein [Polyangium sorediatum]MDI1429862.1 hypothetical protein [Polyangium sorediatum]